MADFNVGRWQPSGFDIYMTLKRKNPDDYDLRVFLRPYWILPPFRMFDDLEK